ncbi:MAG: baseplate J/gp47 family protein [Candidatus Levybacteria bacterium]|nr:baseplate J/gp47 family protein [Candidatus Levybacteria bacterium]
MNLPFIKNFNKKVLPSYFLVLVLRDEKVSAVIFEEEAGIVKIVGQKAEYFSSSIDEVSEEEFLDILDKAISQAESALAENIQTQKTIFGVKESWTDRDQIKKEHLAKLKKASEELGLTPIGFLVISQAIAHLLAKEEGAPISAVLTEVNKKSVTVTLVRAGKSIETKSSGIHDSIPFTVDTLLKHFNVPEILPSRIIIFNGKEDLSQEFISHTWSKSLPFLHLPQITNLPHGFDAKAVLFGAAIQMGFEVLNTEHTEESTENTEVIRQHKDSLGSVGSMDNSVPSVMKDFGFAKDMDVASMPIPQQEESQEELEPIKIGTMEENLPVRKTSGSTNIPALAKSILIVILSLVFALLRKVNVKSASSIFSKVPKGKATFLLSAVAILIIALIASYLLFIKATIALTIDPKITEQNKDILFSTINRTDPEQNTIKGKFVTISQNGTVSTSTTGKKDVGTNSKGAVTIFNTLQQSKTFSEGTIITSSNGLKFTFDSQVTVKAVASRSADEPPPPSQTATVNVTASQLGKESNLPSGTRFTIPNFDISEIVAKNDNPFSGGTKKEVTVVSKADSDKLETELPKQLENKAKEALEKQIGKDKVLLPVFISKSISKKSLNVKVGDETNQLTLTGTVEFKGISYDKNHLIAFSKSLLEKDVPENQRIDYNNIKTAVLDIEEKSDEEVEANLNIKALLVPKIDEAKLAKEVSGKSFKAAEDLLYKLPQISDVDIFLTPKIPFLPKNLPIREKNIKILINIDG